MGENEKVSKPPAHLSREAQRWWRKLCSEFELSDSTAQILLESALSSFDKWQTARKVLSKEGDFIFDRFHQRRAHPALQVERDSKILMLKSFAALHLDIEPLQNSVGRPPGSGRPLGKSNDEDW